MNFIGHATVALWDRGEPLFVLGSMLPDFAGMARTRLAPRTERETPSDLLAGIALHHRTDDAFHGAPSFVALVSATVDELTRLGVARGSARAVGHVGVELLLDGELLHDPAVEAAYIEALRAGVGLEEQFGDAPGGSRWELLRQRLLAHGAPHDYRDPESVLARLVLILSRRPRLALDAEAAQIVRATLPGVQRRVTSRSGALLAEVRNRLTAPTWSMPNGYFP